MALDVAVVMEREVLRRVFKKNWGDRLCLCEVMMARIGRGGEEEFTDIADMVI